MRCVTCLLVALVMCASVVLGAEPNTGQLSSSQNQLAEKRGTQDQEVYALYLKGRVSGTCQWV